jgi:hypothetical protein
LTGLDQSDPDRGEQKSEPCQEATEVVAGGGEHGIDRITGKTAGRTQCGILMHSSLVVTTEGLPFGLAAIKFWTRKKFKGTTALKRKVNPTRVPIEQKESMRVPTQSGHLFRLDSGRPTDLIPATIPS